MLRKLPLTRPLLWVPVGLALLAAGGCAAGSASADEPAPGWAEPGWVAQFRQDREAWQLELIACYAEHGVVVTPSPSGSVDLPIIRLGVDPAGTEELVEAAMWECHERIPQLSWWQLPLDEAAYQRMLDSRECLIAHGHTVPEPPGFEVWLEGGAMWFPHEFAFDSLRHAGTVWTQSDWDKLNRTCPQPGPNTFGVHGLPDVAHGGVGAAGGSLPSIENEVNASGTYTPPDYATTAWRDGGEFVADPCDDQQTLFTGSTFLADFTARGHREAIRFDGWDLDWWLAGQWPADSPPASDMVRVANYWVHSMVNRPQGFEVQVRALDSCEPAMEIHGQIRWIDGSPVPRDPVVGVRPPEIVFADTELGRSIQQMITTGSDDGG